MPAWVVAGVRRAVAPDRLEETRSVLLSVTGKLPAELLAKVKLLRSVARQRGKPFPEADRLIGLLEWRLRREQRLNLLIVVFALGCIAAAAVVVALLLIFGTA